MKYQAYPEYKNSCVEWVGIIPVGWDTNRFKYRVSIITDKAKSKTNPVGLENIDSWTGGFISSDSVYQGEGVVFQPGDLLFGKLRPYLAKVYLANTGGEAVGDFHVFRPKNIVARYLQYLVLTEEYIAIVDGSTYGAKMPRASWEFMSDMGIPCPSLDEQQIIANFLDHETAKIDTLIAKQQQLIKLLKEKRQAVISHAVTKGLNPDAPMKDSGVEWLGEVPEGWKVLQLRRLIGSIEQGKSPECENRLAGADEWAVLKTGCVNGGIFRENEHKALPESVLPHADYEVMKDDLVMSRASGSINLIGRVAYVEKTRSKLLLSDKVFRLFTNEKVSKRYLWILMNSPVVRVQIELAINGAEGLANNITKQSILSFRVVLPPILEQEKIIKNVLSRLSVFDRLISKADEMIASVKERRTALISAAVTGKIDVRNWQPEQTESGMEASA